MIQIEKVPARAIAVASCDNEMTLFVNGKEVAKSDDWTRPISVDVTAALKPGANVLAVEAINWPDPRSKKGATITGPNPAAFIGWFGGFDGDTLAWSSGTDDSWLWKGKPDPGWDGPESGTEGWSHAVAIPGARRLYGAKLDLSAVVLLALSGEQGAHLRAALAFDDPLLASLGRSSREQVVTRRDGIATTLQVLEMTNGLTLDAKLRKGAEQWVANRNRATSTPEGLVDLLWRTAFGRAPTADERATALELVGVPARADGVQDLLWSITKLPEFQLIE